MNEKDPIKLAIDALEEINMLACYASEEDTDSREIVLLRIGEKSRAATEVLQSQPATDGMRKALEFYADEESHRAEWNDDWAAARTPVQIDEGQRAREALGETVEGVM